MPHKLKYIPRACLFCIHLALLIWALFYSSKYLVIKVIDDYNNDINKVLTNVRWFSNYYHNADTRTVQRGISTLDSGVSLVTGKEIITVKALDEGIVRLKDSFQLDDYIWTVALVSNANDNFGYFYPLRERYPSLIFTNRYILSQNQILGQYDIKDNYTRFDSCDVIITEEYLEQDSHELIRTLIYPIYTNKVYQAMLMVDIRSSYFYDRLEQHLKRLTFLWSVDNHPDELFSYKLPLTLPCSNNTIIGVHLNILRLIGIALLATIFCWLLFAFVKKINNLTFVDKMTGFYRKEYIPLKVKSYATNYMLVIDIDYFKNINDNYGHSVGDNVIISVCRLIKATTRKEDICIRWGGEEFVIVFNGPVNLAMKAENIRANIANTIIHGRQVTVSVGGYQGSKHFKSAFELADKMLYQSKHEGRNRVNIHNDT